MAIGGLQSSSTNLWIQPATTSQNIWKQKTTASGNLAITNEAPEDTNQDGVVSPAELLAYELTHPATTPTSRPRPVAPPDTQRGGLLAQTDSSIPNLYAPLSTTSKKRPTTSYDPADINQDGVVSPAELLAYELSHPATANRDRSRSVAPSYTQRGGLQAQTGSHLIDLNV
ncbi:MAG TPA: hypothetical protein VJ486_06675 [Geothrix sp.]|nr:hypothetical protein [Geothrix sp.]